MFTSSFFLMQIVENTVGASESDPLKSGDLLCP